MASVDTDREGSLKDADHSPPPDSIQLFEEPSPITVNHDGSFTADIIVKPGPTSQNQEFPELYVEGPPSPAGQQRKYGPFTVPLEASQNQIGEKYSVRRSADAHTIDIEDPILLEEITSSYPPAGSPVPNVAPNH